MAKKNQKNRKAKQKLARAQVKAAKQRRMKDNDRWKEKKAQKQVKQPTTGNQPENHYNPNHEFFGSQR